MATIEFTHNMHLFHVRRIVTLDIHINELIIKTENTHNQGINAQNLKQQTDREFYECIRMYRP